MPMIPFCPTCTPPSGCIVKPPGKCVLYSGVNLPNLGVSAGQNLDDILGVIDNYISGTGGIQQVFHSDTASITLAGLGTSSSPLTATFTGSQATPTLQEVTTAGATTNVPITISAANSFMIVNGTSAAAVAVTNNNPSAASAGYILQYSNGTANATMNIAATAGTGTGRVMFDVSAPETIFNTNSSSLKFNFGGTTRTQIYSDGTVSGTDADASDKFVTLSQMTAAIPGPADYIVNQVAANQTAGFRITGNGLIAGNVGIGTSVPGEKLTVAAGQIEVRSVLPYTNNAALAYLIFKDVNSVQMGAIGDTSSQNPDIYLTATVGNNIKFVNLPAGTSPALADNFTTAWFDANLNMGIGVPVNQTIGARLHVFSTTEALRIGYNSTVYSSTTITSTGNSVHQLNGNLPFFVFNSPVTTPGGLWTATAAPSTIAYSNSNFGVFGGAVATSASTAGMLFGGASTVAFRACFNGPTSTAMSAGISGANVVVGANGFTTAGTAGSHPIIANLAVTLPAISVNVSTVTDVANIYVDTPSAVGTNNWAIYTRSGASRFGGAMTHAIVISTTDITLTTLHYAVLMNSASTTTVTLPPAALNVGRTYFVKRIGAGSVIIDPNGAELIDGAATKTLTTQYYGAQVVSDGTGWAIIGGYTSLL